MKGWFRSMRITGEKLVAAFRNSNTRPDACAESFDIKGW